MSSARQPNIPLLGVQLCQQHCTAGELREAWTQLDALGIDSLWVWDHFEPLDEPVDGPWFEGMTLVTSMLSETQVARVGPLVCALPLRSPGLLAAMAASAAALAPGRVVLGVGAGGHEPDFDYHGVPFSPGRLDEFDDDVAALRGALDSSPLAAARDVPLLVGGGSNQVLRTAARHGDAWNCIEPLDRFAELSDRLDEMCADIGREASTLERTVGIDPEDCQQWREFVDAGADHLIVGLLAPYGLDEVAELARELSSLRAEHPAVRDHGQS